MLEFSSEKVENICERDNNTDEYGLCNLFNGSSIPFFSTFHFREVRQWLLVSSQTGLHQEYKEVLQSLNQTKFLLVDKCSDGNKDWDYSERCKETQSYKYPNVLQVFLFFICNVSLFVHCLGTRLRQTFFPVYFAPHLC